MITDYISEDYCSEEISSLLEENGYIGDTHTYLDKDGLRAKEITLQSAIKWLRKAHNIDVWVEGHNKRYKGYIHSEQRGDEALFYEDSPEEACEAAIKYCLENLI